MLYQHDGSHYQPPLDLWFQVSYCSCFYPITNKTWLQLISNWSTAVSSIQPIYLPPKFWQPVMYYFFIPKFLFVTWLISTSSSTPTTSFNLFVFQSEQIPVDQILGYDSRCMLQWTASFLINVSIAIWLECLLDWLLDWW